MKRIGFETSKDMNLKDIALLAAIGFISVSLSQFGSTPDLKSFLKTIPNDYPHILWEVSVGVLTLVMVMMFRLRMAGNFGNFLSSGKNKKRDFLFGSLKDSGFKKGEILKEWPYYIVGLFALTIGGKVLGTALNGGFFYDPKLYWFLTGDVFFEFANFIAKALVFFVIFDYFIDAFESRVPAYIYSSVLVLLVEFGTKIFFPGVSLESVLVISLLLAPFMMFMYYWADSSIYYPWVVMSVFESLIFAFYAMQMNFFKIT